MHTIRKQTLPTFLQSNTKLSVILFALTVLLYANTLFHQFAFDDTGLIIDNSLLSDGTSLTQIFTTNYRYGMGFHDEGLYRPLTMLSFVLNNFNLEPLPFHLVNILLNAFNSVLFFFLLLSLTNSRLLSFYSALIFAVHPIHTEAVANIAGRPELLCALFLLLALIVNYTKNSSLSTLCVSSLCFILALLSKETAIVYPALILAIDFFSKDKPLVSRIRYYIIPCVIIIVYLSIRWAVLKETALGKETDFIDNPIFDSPFIVRISTALTVLVLYLRHLLIPYALSPDYSYAQIPPSSTALTPSSLLGLLLLLSLIAVPLILRKKDTYYGIAASLFLIPYLLISNLLFPIGTIMGERLMYLPSAGFAFLSGIGIHYICRNKSKAALTFLGAVIIVYSLLTVHHNRKWHSDLTLFTAAASTSPKSAKVMTNLGFLHGERGDLKRGEKFYRKALERYPDYDEAVSGLGKNLYNQRRFAESLAMYRRAIELKPGESEKYYDYGTVLEKAGKHEEAIHVLSKAVDLSGVNPLYYQALGTSLFKTGRIPQAIAAYQKALSLNGNPGPLLNNLAAIFFQTGQLNEALKCVQKADAIGVRLHPEMVAAIKSAAASHQ